MFLKLASAVVVLVFCLAMADAYSVLSNLVAAAKVASFAAVIPAIATLIVVLLSHKTGRGRMLRATRKARGALAAAFGIANAVSSNLIALRRFE